MVETHGSSLSYAGWSDSPEAAPCPFAPPGKIPGALMRYAGGLWTPHAAENAVVPAVQKKFGTDRLRRIERKSLDSLFSDLVHLDVCDEMRLIDVR